MNILRSRVGETNRQIHRISRVDGRAASIRAVPQPRRTRASSAALVAAGMPRRARPSKGSAGRASTSRLRPSQAPLPYRRRGFLARKELVRRDQDALPCISRLAARRFGSTEIVPGDAFGAGVPTLTVASPPCSSASMPVTNPSSPLRPSRSPTFGSVASYRCST